MSSRNSDALPLLRGIERYRISSLHSNACYKIPSHGSFVFLKVYRPKRPAATYAVRRFLGGMGFRQPVEYTSPGERRAFEEKTLRHWKAHGFTVPDIVDNPLKELGGIPVLATRFIEGLTLREMARNSSRSVEDRSGELRALFTEVAARHGSAFAAADPLLFHIDANTRNILFAENAVYHVDFEMGRPWEPPVLSATREVLKLLVTLAEDLDPESRAPVMKIFRDCYHHDEVFQRIRTGVIDRPFQSFHRFSNERKKKRNPHKVTLYDLMEYLW